MKTMKKGGLSKKQKKKSPLPKIRTGKQFVWRVLGKLIEDVEGVSDDPEIDDALRTLRGAVRNRDVEKYVTVCSDDLSLQKLNQMYGDPSHLQKIRLLRILSLFQKYDFPDSPIDKMDAAIRSFYKYEEQCAKTNLSPLFTEGLDDHDSGNQSTFDCLYTHHVLSYARNFIARTLGRSPDLTQLCSVSRHGPGACADKRGSRSIPVEKFIPPIGVTDSAKELFLQVLNSDERWMRSIYLAGYTGPLTVPTEVAPVEFVPKNAKTLRGIMLEPTGNVYMQLGVDAFIKSRLRRLWSIDLSTQTKNQSLALRYSLNGGGVTVDLSGASDTVSLIWLLLFPDEWAALFYALRTSQGRLPSGEIINFEKISSMGNGFTFALETLIFSSVLYGVCKVEGFKWNDLISDIAVYGDDIVIPSCLYPLYSMMLRRLGFSLNKEKSFSSGPIRESCGADFFFGKDISRPTISSCPDSVQDLFVILNSIYLWSKETGINLQKTYEYVLSLIPNPDRFFGPENEEYDSHIFVENPVVKYNKDYQRYEYRYERIMKSHKLVFFKQYYSNAACDIVTRQVFHWKVCSYEPRAEYVGKIDIYMSYLPMLYLRSHTTNEAQEEGGNSDRRETLYIKRLYVRRLSRASMAIPDHERPPINGKIMR